jgi:predicted small lipoprotein YifL
MRTLLLILGLVFTLAACGYKTPLALPKPKPAAQPAPAPAASAPAPAPEKPVSETK